METFHTVKTPFSRVFYGTQEHLNAITNIVTHTTHFIKWYFLNCNEQEQEDLHVEAINIILLLMNNSNITTRAAKAAVLRTHFLPFVTEYKKLVQYNDTPLHNFNQMSVYHSRLIHTNMLGITTSVDEHAIPWQLRTFSNKTITDLLWKCYSNVLNRYE